MVLKIMKVCKANFNIELAKWERKMRRIYSVFKIATFFKGKIKNDFGVEGLIRKNLGRIKIAFSFFMITHNSKLKIYHD